MSDLLDAFACKVYDPPMSDLRDNGGIRDLTNPICVMMLVTDFEVEVMMSGIDDFIGNSTGRYANETVEALKAIECDTQAAHLRAIIDVAAAVGMTHESIQAERVGLEPYTVTSFQEMHADKWNAASKQMGEIESMIDFNDIQVHAAKFVELHSNAFQAALGQ